MSTNQEDAKPKGLLSRHLPLETETCFFILANSLDAIMTKVLLHYDQFRESNFVADFVLKNFGMVGMIAFKFIIVTVVVLIAQLIARKDMRVARYLLIGGTIVVGLVVAYSCYLWVAHSGYFEWGNEPPEASLDNF